MILSKKYMGPQYSSDLSLRKTSSKLDSLDLLSTS